MLPRSLRRVAGPLLRAYFRSTRGLTLGVRALLINDAGEVLLVRHTYTPGWHLPGGGVEWGEALETALARELVEEAGVKLIGRPRLISIHSNHSQHPRDHVAVFSVTDWALCAATSRGEIAEVGWFAADALPADTTPSTRRRIEEASGGAAPDLEW